MILKNYAMINLSLLLSMLISCNHTSSRKKNTLNIYQPSTITLTGEVPIQTIEGIYTPQKQEVWHSDMRYRTLERILYNK